MKNWEFYEKELRNCDDLDELAITKSGRMVRCVDINCGVCACHSSNGGCSQDNIIEFLYQEHKERITLTKDEQMLCNLLGRGWIARDNNGDLFWYENEAPVKGDFNWITGIYDKNTRISSLFPQCKFEFIKWEDEEPRKVQVSE